MNQQLGKSVTRDSPRRSADSQCSDCARLRLAADLDTAFTAATAAGVEAVAHGKRITREGVWLAEEMPFEAPVGG